jgi:hypothetical protein
VTGNAAAAAAYRSRRDVRFRRIGEEAVVVRQEVPEALVLNPVGARVLELLAGGAPLGAVGARLAAEFEVAPAEAEADARAFAAELESAGVIEPAPAAESGPGRPERGVDSGRIEPAPAPDAETDP